MINKETEIKKAVLDEKTVNRLIELSGIWEEEGCTTGLIKNTAEDLREPVYAAYDGGEIIGYAFGHFYTQEKKAGYVQPGGKCFYLDELYVLPQYRSHGTGKRLFDAISAEAAEQADFLCLATSTKDYKRVLKFYVEDGKMDFHDAFLTKKLK